VSFDVAFFHANLSVFVDLIDISPKVTSSSVYEDEGILFVPQLAVDRVNSRYWSSCFISKKEMNPWWRLDLGKQETILRVHIDFRDTDISHQSDVKREDIDDLTIYVDDNSDSASGAHTQCGNPLNPTSGNGLLSVICSSGTIGRYIHIIVKSSTATYLALCEVFVNFGE